MIKGEVSVPATKYVHDSVIYNSGVAEASRRSFQVGSGCCSSDATPLFRSEVELDHVSSDHDLYSASVGVEGIFVKHEGVVSALIWLLFNVVMSPNERGQTQREYVVEVLSIFLCISSEEIDLSIMHLSLGT